MGGKQPLQRRQWPVELTLDNFTAGQQSRPKKKQTENIVARFDNGSVTRENLKKISNKAERNKHELLLSDVVNEIDRCPIFVMDAAHMKPTLFNFSF